MNQIIDPPNVYDFGLSFNYDVWTAGSNVTLTNVPWDSMYRDVIDFKTSAALDAFVDNNSFRIQINNLFHVKPSNPVIRLDVPYNTALRYNYLRVSNQAQPIPGDSAKSFYYFIRDVNYIAPNTTELVIQLDVWQTFIRDVKLKSGYLERGHYAVQRGQSAPNWQFFEVPESIDLGTAYVTNNFTKYFDVITPGQANAAITSSISLEDAPGTVDAPVIKSAPGSGVQTYPGAGSTYTVASANIQTYFSSMRNYPWITQGISRVVLYPAWCGVGTAITGSPSYPPKGAGGANILNNGNIQFANYSNKDIGNVDGFRERIKAAFRARWGNSSYDWAFDRFGKLLAAPYSFVEFTTMQGNSVDLDPLKFIGDDIELRATVSIIPGDERIIIRTPLGNYASDQSDENILSINELPTVSVLNDNATIALASQARSLQQARDSASWAQTRALAGNANSFDNANTSIQMSSDLANISRNSDAASVGISNDLARNSAILNGVTGVIGGAVSGAPAGPAGVAAGLGMSAGSAVAGGIGVGMNIDASNQQLAVRQNASRQSGNVTAGAASRIADNNKALGDWSAKGDYANTIAAIDAKIQDTKMTPPSVVGGVGSGASHFAIRGGLRLWVRIKHIDGDAIRRVVAYWSRYGYTYNGFINIDNLQCMKNFTYWKLSEVFLDASGLSAPEGVLNAMRGIFEKGVTVWHDVEKIGTYDFEGNTPIV